MLVPKLFLICRVFCLRLLWWWLQAEFTELPTSTLPGDEKDEGFARALAVRFLPRAAENFRSTSLF